MSSSQDSQYRTLKARKTAAAHPPALATQGHSGPTTFFLRSEKEVEKSTQRGRKQSRGSPTAEEEDMQKTPMESAMGDSGFGVESLADTIRSTSSSSDAGLSRTDSNASEPSVEAGADGSNVLAGRKRKAGNPVHPKILATGQRIISAEYASTGSPTSLRSAESPIRTHLRRASTSSSINLSQPLTPLKMSPQPESAMPSTPRSGSPKSFRLSDEEASLADETHSQAIQSSSGEEDGEEEGGSPSAGAMPQLVMPSISMPTRRPFTQRGKQMGRLKVMVVGARGVGKTSLIQSICRVCEDVVHMDPITGHIRDHPEPVRSTTANGETKQIVEIGASTREYPPWWTDFETRRQLLRRKSIGEGVLERNLTFVDTPGFHDGCHVSEVLQHFKALMARIGNMEKMHDIELISMLSGEGGVQVDAVLYVFDSATSSTESPTQLQLDSAQAELLRYLCKWTNVIPLIGRADLVEADELVARKRQIMEIFKTLPAEPCVARNMDGANNEPSASATEPQEPLTISSALGDDPETIEASVLMSSGYLQPLLPSELNVFVEGLLEPENVARLRHLSATKFLLWRQENLGFQLGLQNQLLLKSPCFESESPAETSTGSIAEEPSKVLVPHGSSSYFRSTSPSASESSAISGNVMGTSSYALARYNDQTNTNVPFRQVRLAKWAQDLQRSLDNERRRYKQMYVDATSDWTSNSAAECSEKPDLSQSLVTTSGTRPAKGRLGGDLGIIDPRDPLGVLAFGEAFRRRGWFALQIAGGCGLIGAVAWWVVRNWVEVQEWVGFGQPVAFGVTAVPAPTTRGWLQWERESFDDIYLNLSKKPGKCRIAESGVGWKPTGGDTFTLDKAEFLNAQWSRASRGYELKIFARNEGVVLLDGFKQDDYETILKCFKVWYGVELVQKEHALRGWNWGKGEMGRNELTFNVRNQPAFEIPYTEISNTNLAGKNEVAVEFSLPADGEETGTNGHLGGARSKGKKMGGAVDQLTEMRFYIPGTETRKGKNEDGEEIEDEGEEEEHNAANLFYEALMDKAEIGEVAGDTFATFLDILHLTPRGRFDIDLYEKSFRLRGKTYDYKISYDNAKRFFLLPKPDDMHQLLCIGLDPPLRQGQTRYPFLVMQFKKDEEVNIELNMTEEDLNQKYAGKLQARYEEPIGNVIGKIFRGLTGRKLTQPSHDFSSHHQLAGVKCSIKANEGHLFCLDRAFLFVPKPATYISFDHVASVTMSRVGGAVSASRTFDITVTLKNGAGEHQFSNINREEQVPLETFLKIKNIKTKNEMDSENAMMAAALDGDPDLASSEDEEPAGQRGSADEDDESVDEDFQADSDSDVAEEFDSDAKSSGSGSDAEMEDVDGEADGMDAESESDTAAKVERPKKKVKTGK